MIARQWHLAHEISSTTYPNFLNQVILTLNLYTIKVTEYLLLIFVGQ
jgi:hypothetical protein